MTGLNPRPKASAQLCLGGVALLLLAGGCRPLFGQKFRITSPPDGAVAYSKQTLTVHVDAESSMFRSIAVDIGPSVGQAPAVTAPPYLFSIQIPPSIPSGHYLIVARGIPQSGGDPIFSDPVDVDIERLDVPTQLKPDGNSVNLGYVGSELPLGVVGVFADGARVRLTQSKYTTYSSDTPDVVTVDERGIVAAMGPGKANLTVTYRNPPVGEISIRVPAYVPVPITVAPRTASLYASQSETFAATLAIDPDVDQSVVWSIRPAVGSIDQTGRYTAPASVTRRQDITVTATSVAAPTKSGSVHIWVLP